MYLPEPRLTFSSLFSQTILPPTIVISTFPCRTSKTKSSKFNTYKEPMSIRNEDRTLGVRPREFFYMEQDFLLQITIIFSSTSNNINQTFLTYYGATRVSKCLMRINIQKQNAQKPHGRYSSIHSISWTILVISWLYETED